MTYPRVADRENVRQIWRIAASMLINSRGQPTRDGPLAWGLIMRLINPQRKKLASFEIS
jgi:hypothetical protein